MDGPYMNEDGDWWVPVWDTSRDAARAAVMACTNAQRVAYIGKVEALITEHEFGCNCSPTCYRYALSWHFQDRDDDA